MGRLFETSVGLQLVNMIETIFKQNETYLASATGLRAWIAWHIMSPAPITAALVAAALRSDMMLVYARFCFRPAHYGSPVT